MWWTYCFHRNSLFLWISTKISMYGRFWSNGPMDWLQICWLCWSYSNLGLNVANFPDFNSKISMILKQFFIEYLRNRDTSVSQNQVPHRYLHACIECAETPGFQISTGRLFCIMHTLLLSTNWFWSNVGGMLLIVWNSLIWIWILC
jgi:hypothetical protein